MFPSRVSVGITSCTSAVFLVYDADCPVCVRISRVFKIYDRADRLKLLPLTDTKAHDLLTCQGLTTEQQRGTFHVITPEGRIYSGETAIPHILREFSGGKLLMACLTRLPGHQRILHQIYQWLANAHMD